jgi:hypothetical protein
VALWTPKFLAVSCWWDAQDYASLSFNGSKVSQIGGQNGTEYHATNATDSTRPTYTPDGLNGHPAIRFAEGQTIGNAVRNISGVASVFYVQRTTDNQYIVLGPNSTARYIFIGHNTDTANPALGGVGAPQKFWKNGEAQTWGSPANVYTALHNQSVVVSATNANFSAWTEGLWLSGYAHASWRFAGDIGEFIVIPGYISQADTDRVHGYLAHKWGLADQLPADHPYKLAPPEIDLTGVKILGGEVFDIKGSDGKFYRTHTIKASQNIEVLEPVNAEILLVGGGGGGAGLIAGGGGGGGVLDEPLSLTPGILPVVIGSGGRGGSGWNSTDQYGRQGTSTSFAGLEAFGGGGGRRYGGNTSIEYPNGGSGGGATSTFTPGGTGTSGQGHDGGANPVGGSDHGAGGGGAGGPGGDTATLKGGDSGPGLDVSGRYGPVGFNGYVGAGGAGGVRSGNSRVAGTHLHGGGFGTTTTLRAGDGAPNSGAGGGGAGYATTNTAQIGGNGAGGVLVIRYEIENPDRGVGGEVSYIEVDGTPYVVHTFRKPGKFHATADLPIEYLIVGGGGAGGGQLGGGGGAGGFLEGSTELAAGEIDIAVGLGSKGQLNTAANGGNSSLGDIVATGGGAGAGGAVANEVGRNGGSGGGGSRRNGNSQPNNPGGTGIAGQGHDGGTGCHSGGVTGSNEHGGGGGGAGGAGVNGSASAEGGKGGDGLPSSIDGTLRYYAAGGGGGVYTSGTKGGDGGRGGGGGGGTNTIRPTGRGGLDGYSAGHDGLWGNATSGSAAIGGAAGRNTGSGGGGAGWSTSVGGDGADGIVVIRYIASWSIKHARHTHTVPDLGKLLTEIHSADSSHVMTSTTPTFDPASILSVLKNLSATQKHYARNHLIKLDFVYDQVQHNVYPGSLRLDFDPAESRPIYPGGYTLHPDLKYGTAVLTKTSARLHMRGLQQEWPTRYGVHFVVGFDARLDMTFRSEVDPPAELPLVFNFEGQDGAWLLVHNARQLQRSTQCNVGVRTPLIIQAAAQVQASSQPALTPTSPLAGLNARQVQTAPVVSIRHTIPLTEIQSALHGQFAESVQTVQRSPARAHSLVHKQVATKIVVTHISPLVINKGTQKLASIQIALRNWVGLFPDSSRHLMVDTGITLYVWTPLVLRNARHLMRSMRLNFLPADWIFRAIIDIEPDLRVLVLEPEERVLALDPEARESVLEAEERDITIPAEIRIVELESVGRASTVER